MNNGLYTAIKCFDENRNLFGDPRNQPEKFNLYNGLSSFAEGIAQLEAEIQTLRQEVEYLRSQLRR